MKEAFDLIKERLEESSMVTFYFDGKPPKQCVPIEDALEIVSEVEAEYGNGKTNADRIRAMSDEELAEFLPIVSNCLCRPTDECMNTICNRGECEKTKECALDWLKSTTTD